jgi:outer membrane protein assembly factor BamA
LRLHSLLGQLWHTHCTGQLQTVLKFVPQSPRLAALIALLMLSGCASIPTQRYGLESVAFKGVKKLDEDALRACLATEQRDKVTLGLGALISPNCGVPPFDKSRWSARLFALPWTEWPTYDEAVLKLDLDRIERWYQARGYYGVKVLDVQLSREGARVSDACKEKDCELGVTIRVDEGEPVHIRKLAVVVDGELTPELREDIQEGLKLEKGDVFDEALYDEAREGLADVLREVGYARVAVEGEVVVNRGLLVADIKLNVTPGPVCHVGKVSFVSKGKVPEAPVRAVTFLKQGQLYEESALADAQRSIYALGAFSAVTVRGDLENSKGAEIPIVIELEERRESQYMVGVGVMSGTAASGVAAQENISIPQWDVHLLGSYDDRNFFGGLRRFHIEERPRMLFLEAFPQVPDNSPRFGNTITADFSQPGVIDARTNLFLETSWDHGPDPFLLFFRNDVGVALGLERGFFTQRLSARVAVHQELMQVSRRQPITEDIQKQLENRWIGNPDPKMDFAPRGPIVMSGAEIEDRQADFYNVPSSYRLPFVEERISLDLRDDAARPTKGGYFRVSAHQAIKFGDGDWGQRSWNYLRLTPEARGYVPIGLGMVLAGRFALGWLKIFEAGKKLDEQSRNLGAQAYRLRGGGANSVRGFMPGDLGDGRTGGTHRWEASLELRVPLSKNFSIVAFGDVGDVNAGCELTRTYSGVTQIGAEPVVEPNTVGKPIYSEKSGARLTTTCPKRKNDGFRFNHLNTTVGGGLRYYTIIGPVRLDVGVRPPKLAGAEIDDARLRRYDRSERQFKGFRGAVHLTIGESF